MATTFNDAPTKTVQVDGTDFAYRVIGEAGGPPIVLLHHFTGCSMIGIRPSLTGWPGSAA
jgi:pimeloyl-ACP methyl ester carboxylesterase